MNQIPQHKSLVIGLTGGIASGKSAAAAKFVELDIPCIDADQVARDVVEPGEPALQHIAEHFGSALITPNGVLDRAALRKLVFNDPEQKKWLESLLHPLINQRIRDWLGACKTPYCILASPLLLETRQRELVDRILVIDVPESVQIARAMARDQNSEDLVRRIIATQSGREYKRQHADDIILNDKDLAHLYHEVAKLHEYYLELAQHDR
ncbi:dephospho-CoA kinase [Hahella chejuensis KCTC 2396]|uniref:Dephospho-CoA kinase n=1 Tax=Hahella chejuensis (strain KCTC 2396) TaxID=349521 RepID=COAE_HAHCH|nr:dephospho-CoA kinase [Hahella chejuensis]Q2SBL9.1 RecName: Full=Dephospho-CoA kinase; AltName: Full=Dephosphocoenzyme A kinase [Hahella chejuensis KCTC 2396]ABC31955.1 dephospho-CoA kinase [Hahella chejuensis KCTC 2396]